MAVLPSEEVEVSSATPAIAPSRRSRGAATDEAMTAGSAPGWLAVTTMVGRSTLGSGAMGRAKYATMPDKARPRASIIVAMGRRMKGAEIDTATPLARFAPCR